MEIVKFVTLLHMFYTIMCNVPILINSNYHYCYPCQAEDKQKAGIAWARIRAALDVLGVKDAEQKAIWRVLAAIYHLGVAGTTSSE